MLTIAHRGASALYPENTLRALLAAADFGADMCEFDVRMTRDGEVVVIHDATVNRTTDGRGRVAEMSAAAIKRLDAGVRFGAEFRDERIPTLAEVAAALADDVGDVGDVGWTSNLRRRGWSIAYAGLFAKAARSRAR
jgi:glycerophosphoryl diester phosphodiesterase